MAKLPAVYVDTARTFEALVFIACNPRLEHRSTKQAARTDGTPKWDVQLMAALPPDFDGAAPQTEVITVGTAHAGNPCADWGPMDPVELVDLRYGQVQTKAGGTSYMTCAAIRNLRETVVKPGKAA